MSLSVIFCSFGIKKSGATDGQHIEWSHTGIGGGGAQFNPAVSPHDDNMAFVSCDMGGSFVTYNGGESWRMFNLGSMVRFFVFDPVDPNVVYAQSFGLFKSEDKGLTWNLLYPNPSDVVCKVSKGDHAQEVILTKDTTSRVVQALAIDPIKSKNMYAAITINQSLALYSSTDGGIEWQKEKDLENAVKNIFIDPSSPVDQRTLYVAWANGVDHRINGQWQRFGTPSKDVKFNFFTGGYDAKLKKYILYAISGKSYYNREDTKPGIFFSENGGKTWDLVWRDQTTKGRSIVSPNYSGCWLNSRFGPYWGGNPFSITVSATNANICYGSDFGRTVRTMNGGKTWEPVYTKKLPDGSWATRGIEVTTGYNIIFDPFDVNHIFIALADIGLIQSKNGGKGWLSAIPY